MYDFKEGFFLQSHPFVYFCFSRRRITQTNIDWVELHFDGTSKNSNDVACKVYYTIFYDEEIGHRMDLIQRIFEQEFASEYFTLHKRKVVRRVRWERESIQCLITTRILFNKQGTKFVLCGEDIPRDIIREILHQLFPTLQDQCIENIMIMSETKMAFDTKQEFINSVKENKINLV